MEKFECVKDLMTDPESMGTLTKIMFHCHDCETYSLAILINCVTLFSMNIGTKVIFRLLPIC